VHRASEPIIEKLANAERGASHRLAVRLDRSTVWLDHLATNKNFLKSFHSSILYHSAGARNYHPEDFLFSISCAVLDCGTMVSKVKVRKNFRPKNMRIRIRIPNTDINTNNVPGKKSGA
jgi:hypothetical protein